jgi:hypothetical protein
MRHKGNMRRGDVASDTVELMRTGVARPAIIGDGDAAAGERLQSKKALRNVMHLNARLRIWGLGVRVSPGAPGLALVANASRPGVD